MNRQSYAILLHRLILILGALSIPLYLWERAHYVEERSRFSIALQAADAGRWFWNLSSGEVYWDDQMFTLFDTGKRGPVTIDSFMEFIHPVDKERVKLGIGKAIASRGRYQDIFRIVTPSGEIREIRAAGMVNETGVYMTGINLPALRKNWFQALPPIPELPLSGFYTVPVPGSLLTPIDG